MTLASKIKIDISKKFELDFVSLFPLISHTTTYSLDWLGRSVSVDIILLDDLLCKALTYRFGILKLHGTHIRENGYAKTSQTCWQRK